MVKISFPNISKNWEAIAHRRVQRTDSFTHVHSLKGRAVCLVLSVSDTLGLAASGIGRLLRKIVGLVPTIFNVLTLNTSPKKLLANVIDISVGGVLLPFALLANLIRGIAGAIIHPGLMLKTNPL